MSKKNETVNKIFKAVADPRRREIFHLLIVAGVSMSISQISQQFNISRQGVTKHIKLLEEANMIKIRNEGRERFCEADPTPLNEIKNWLAVYDKFWGDKLKSLDEFLKAKG